MLSVDAAKFASNVTEYSVLGTQFAVQRAIPKPGLDADGAGASAGVRDGGRMGCQSVPGADRQSAVQVFRRLELVDRLDIDL